MPYLLQCHTYYNAILTSYYNAILTIEHSFLQIVDDEVTIHGKHEEKSDAHGSVSREFTRRYKLPADVDPADVSSSLSEAGVLSIRGPRKGGQAAAKSIPISIQGKSAVEGAKK
ncbi:putative alpha-crystallin B chain-like isoform X2 [Apostichopus japonicus]|uniref:Putative alpha-crystallin B chain-like isoform X2 n=1 Tax=Stichopus japonicus TaxID=307972 RepID=A0A2G8KQP7_STIJA|nr:putative alpha-crystallin B chain-like isoform X2 [Apostichopus japonicus]